MDHRNAHRIISEDDAMDPTTAYARPRGVPHLVVGIALQVEGLFFALVVLPDGLALGVPLIITGMILCLLWKGTKGGKLQREQDADIPDNASEANSPLMTSMPLISPSRTGPGTAAR